MRTIRDAVTQTTDALKLAGVENPRLDARLLVAHVLHSDTSQTFLRDQTILAAAQEDALGKLISRRKKREPVSRIVGQREFWGLSFEITPATLDPRPDTETIVSTTIDHVKRLNITTPRILDLGTGTGCIALALLSAIPDASAVAVDLDEQALHVAQKNAETNGLRDRISFACMSWAEALLGPFDVIVSNPPYLSSDDMAQLSPEVRYDPERALFGGEDGLECYRAILNQVPRRAAKPAFLVLELGMGQAGRVAEMAEKAGLRVVEIRSDLASIPRCLVAEI